MNINMAQYKILIILFILFKIQYLYYTEYTDIDIHIIYTTHTCKILYHKCIHITYTTIHKICTRICIHTYISYVQCTCMCRYRIYIYIVNEGKKTHC